MTTKVVRQARQGAEQSEQAAFPESPESQLPPPPDPYAPLRAQAGELEAALSKLEQVEADIVKVQVQLEETTQKHAALLPQEDVDMDELSNLGSRVNACQARLEHLAGRLLEVQRDVQSRLIELGGRGNALYRQTRGELINRAIEEILALLHPDVREMQRQLVFHNLAQFGTAVLDAQQHLAIEPHPLASNPLEDT